MRPLIHEIVSSHSPESLVEQLQGEPGVVLLRSALFDSPQSRYSFVAARPFLTFRSFGPHCETEFAGGKPLPRSAEHRSSRTLTKTRGAILRAPNTVWQVQFGNPWHLLDGLMARYELLDEVDLPFPLGGCFGYWGYGLKNFIEPRLKRVAVDDLELPDCHVGFYDSLVVFDHRLQKTWIVSTGLTVDGSRTEARAQEQVEFWRACLQGRARCPRHAAEAQQGTERRGGDTAPYRQPARALPHSTFSRAGFLAAVQRSQAYIRAGDIYQVNLAQRLAVPCDASGWEIFQYLAGVSSASFSSYLEC